MGDASAARPSRSGAGRSGSREPDEPSTLPKRTATKRVETSSRCPNASTIHSHSAFDSPITVVGLTALSVEMRTKRSAPNSTAISATVRVREHVVAHRLDGIRLHQRHVLVGRGVEDDGGTVAPRRPGASWLGSSRPRAPAARPGSLARPRAPARSRTAPARSDRRARGAPGRRARSGGTARPRSSRRRR